MRRQTGPHGVTLLSVSGAGEMATEFLSTAIVRFESLEVTPDSDGRFDDLAARMTERLDERAREAGERGWIVSWTIRASHGWLEKLASPMDRARLIASLPQQRGGMALAHEITLVPDTEEPADDPFSTEFEAALAQRRDLLTTGAGRTSLVGELHQSRHGPRIEQLLAACDEQDVFNRALQHGKRLAQAARREGD